MTFVLHDAGETKAMAPVMQSLDSLQVGYSILAEGTAKNLLAHNPHVLPLPQEISALSTSNPWAARAAQEQLNQGLNATCILTGLVSPFQKAWADFFRQQGKPVIGYYDGFDFQRLRNSADAFWGSLTAMITPSRDTAAFWQNRFPNIPVVPLGQPTLEVIPQAMAQTNVPALAAQLGVDLTKPTVLFVGGYGKGYAEAFSLYCDAIQLKLKNSVPGSRPNFLVSLHPKVNGVLESQIIQEKGLQSVLKIIPKTIETAQALAFTDGVVSQNSTMTVQSLFQGKQVVLVGDSGMDDTGGQDVFNPAQAYGLVNRYQSVEALSQRLQGFDSSPLPLNPNRFQSGSLNLNTERLYAQLGIPKFSTQAITQYLLSWVQGVSSMQRRG
ncbi:MAG: hypothetical protein K2X66_18250 [Cyanobacteria bacterium]|nr:hypothetical protein [Cyanobacteriota bacterium]